MRKKNVIIAAIVVLSIVSILWGCRYYPWQSGVKQNKDKTVLQVAVSGTAREIQVFKDVGTLYMEQHPDVTIDWIDIGNDRVAKTMSLIQTGNPPDIFFMNDNVIYLAKKEVLMPLNSFIEADADYDLERFDEKFLAPLEYDGQLYALPLEITPYVIYYNADLFRKYGVPLPTNDWTQEEFYAACRALTVPEYNQYAIQILSTWHTQTLGFLSRAGGKLLNDDMQTTALDSPEALRALQMMYDMVAVEHLSPNPAEAAAMGNTSLYVMFQNQKIAMTMAGMWNVPDFVEAELPFEWDVVKMPVDQNQMTKGNTTLWAISNQTEHPQEAWDFLALLTGPEGMQTLAKAGYAIPAASDEAAAAIIGEIEQPEHIQTFLDAKADIDNREDSCAKKMEIINVWDSEIERLLQGSVTPEECQASLVKQINDILSEK